MYDGIIRSSFKKRSALVYLSRTLLFRGKDFYVLITPLLNDYAVRSGFYPDLLLDPSCLVKFMYDLGKRAF